MAFVKGIVNAYLQYRRRPDADQKRSIAEIRDEVSMLFSQEKTLAQNIASHASNLNKLKVNKNKLDQYCKVYYDHLQKLDNEKQSNQEPLVTIDDSSPSTPSKNLSREEIEQLKKTLDEIKPQITTINNSITSLESKINALTEKKSVIKAKRVQIEKELIQYDPSYVSLQDIEIRDPPSDNEEDSDKNSLL